MPTPAVIARALQLIDTEYFPFRLNMVAFARARANFMTYSVEPTGGGLRDPAAGEPKVLIVDDAPAVRLMVSLRLRASGFDTLLAPTFDEARSLIEDDSTVIDVALIDISAGSSFDGLAVVNALMTRRPEVRMVLASSNEQRTDSARRLCARAVLIAKPYCIDLLMQCVHNAAGVPLSAPE